MILSVSRRTDIPSYYSEWFLNRLKEGFVYVRNPFNANQVSRIELNPLKIECKCIDDVLISNIIDESLILPKDKNQRDQCCCATSVDIGAYNTCKNFCRYCYANYSEKSVLKNMENHDKTSPLITGFPTGEEKITERRAIKNKSVQLPLFDDKKTQQGV